MKGKLKPKTARDLMHPVEWATRIQNLSQVAEVMWRESYSQLPVREGETNRGRVTEDMIRDQLEKMNGDWEAVGHLLVNQLPKNGSLFPEVSPDLEVLEVIKQLKKAQALLVKAGPNKSDWGIITRADLLKIIKP